MRIAGAIPDLRHPSYPSGDHTKRDLFALRTGQTYIIDSLSFTYHKNSKREPLGLPGFLNFQLCQKSRITAFLL
jgi:hypothetical protein